MINKWVCLFNAVACCVAGTFFLGASVGLFDHASERQMNAAIAIALCGAGMAWLLRARSSA